MSKLPSVCAATLLFAIGLVWQPGAVFAQGEAHFEKPYPTLATLERICNVGAAIKSAAPAGQGETPLRIKDITTISAVEAKCVFDRYPRSVLFIDAAGEDWVQDAFPMFWAATRGSNDQTQREVERVMANLTRKEESLPIIVYCHHARCGLSPEVARRVKDAGYGPVLWMREGIEVWHAAGYPIKTGVSKWTQPIFDKYAAVKVCFDSQSLPPTGADWTKISLELLDRCSAQQNALRSAMSDYSSPSFVEQTVAEVRRSVASLSPLQARFEAERSQRKKAESDARLRRERGIGVPANQIVAGYEMCWVAADTPEFKRFFIYSDVYPAQIGKEGFARLRTFNMTNADSERGLAFSRAVRLPQRLIDLQARYVGQNGCTFYQTRDEAEADRRRLLQEPGGSNLAFPWRPQ